MNLRITEIERKNNLAIKMEEPNTIDILTELCLRNLTEIINEILSLLSVPEIRRARLVSRQWRDLIEREVMRTKSFLKREFHYSLTKTKPFVVDIEEYQKRDVEETFGIGAWDEMLNSEAKL